MRYGTALVVIFGIVAVIVASPFLIALLTLLNM